MSKRLTILMSPMEGWGHVNACIGIAEELRDRGHRVVFVVSKAFEGKLVKYGFEEEVVDTNDTEDENVGKDAGEQGGKMLMESGLLSGLPSIKKMELMLKGKAFSKFLIKMKENDPKLEAIVAKYNPDVIVIDHVIGSPALIYSGKPWVGICSSNPLFAWDDERAPPGFSGYASNGDKSEWKAFIDLRNNGFQKSWVPYDQWLEEKGLPKRSKNSCMPNSPWLNIYGYPEEFDYTDIITVPENWFRIDSFSRKGMEEFSLPDTLKERNENSKLIYLSLGSMGSIDVQLMKRLVQILSKTEHKYIVSKGPFHDKYELADNMWGERSVPQTKVLPLVDLVITHGGNNSVTETFSLGKPMIVMPLFGDQFDNAQRIDEKGFGVRLDPYNCSDEELLNAIEKLLNDKQLKSRLDSVVKRLTNSKSITKVCEKIEEIVG